MLTYLREHHLDANLASLNYRLSPAVKHPSHEDDVIAALNYLKQEYGMKTYVLVGHSAGACLAFQSHDSVSGCKGIIGVEGIYDLTELVDEYPEYRYFVEEAFGKDKSVWQEASPTFRVHQRPLISDLTIQCVQSLEDDLLSPRQTETMFRVLSETKVNLKEIAWIRGTHDISITTPTFHNLVYNFIIKLTQNDNQI